MIRILLSLAAVSAFASPHTPVRLDEAGFAMEHVQVRNQRSIGDCYAQAAAQFYDAWRFKLGETDYSRQSCGFEINQRFKVYVGDSSIDGGKLQEIVPLLSSQGTCAESDLNKNFIGTDVDGYASKVMEIYEAKRDEFHKKRDEEVAKLDPPWNRGEWFLYNALKRRIDTKYREEARLEGIRQLKEYHSQVLVNQITDDRLNNIEANKDVVTIFNTIDTIKCNAGTKLHAPVAFKVDHRSHTGWGMSIKSGTLSSLYYPTQHIRTREVLERIHAELDYHKDAMPIGIGYCSAVLKQGRAFKFIYTKAKACGRHASLVIGRRADPTDLSRQQLLIRNTWGNNCGSYHRDWTCDGPKGSIWVDENILAEAIFETQVFVRK